MERFRDQVVIVTGAASGIGRAMSELFAAEGAKVIGADLDVSTVPSPVLSAQVDVSQPEQVTRLAEIAIGTFGQACTWGSEQCFRRRCGEAKA